MLSRRCITSSPLANKPAIDTRQQLSPIVIEAWISSDGVNNAGDRIPDRCVSEHTSKRVGLQAQQQLQLGEHGWLWRRSPVFPLPYRTRSTAKRARHGALRQPAVLPSAPQRSAEGFSLLSASGGCGRHSRLSAHDNRGCPSSSRVSRRRYAASYLVNIRLENYTHTAVLPGIEGGEHSAEEMAPGR